VAAVSRDKLFDAVVAGTWLTAALALETARRDLQARREAHERPGSSEPLLDLIGAVGDLLAAYQGAIAAEAELTSGRRRRRGRRRH
jgi:hypothetical protein